MAPANLDTWAGPVRVEWDTSAPMTPHGQMPFFIEFLKVGQRFDALVADCPLTYTNPNAPPKRDVLGTTMLSVLAGHKRYAHITALRNDGVLPELLGMKKIVSEDAVRRAFLAIGEEDGTRWMQRHLDYCTAPLLAEPWILDMDSIVSVLSLRYLRTDGEAPLRPSGRRRCRLQSEEDLKQNRLQQFRRSSRSRVLVDAQRATYAGVMSDDILNGLSYEKGAMFSKTAIFAPANA